jgi:hypothetical protein
MRALPLGCRTADGDRIVSSRQAWSPCRHQALRKPPNGFCKAVQSPLRNRFLMREVATGGLVALSEPFRNASAAATVSGSGCHSNELLGSPTPRWSPREGFEGEAEPRAVEGGRLAEELLGEYRKEPGLPMRGTAALEFSIALEIDSLDLYLRMARASGSRRVPRPRGGRKPPPRRLGAGGRGRVSANPLKGVGLVPPTPRVRLRLGILDGREPSSDPAGLHSAYPGDLTGNRRALRWRDRSL